MSPVRPSFPPQPDVYPLSSLGTPLLFFTSQRCAPFRTGSRTTSHVFSTVCCLLNSLASLFTARSLYFQQLAASFCQNRGVWVPLRQLRALCASALSFALDLLAFCFHTLMNCFFRNPLVFTSIQIALCVFAFARHSTSQRRHPLCAPSAPTSAPSVLRFFPRSDGEWTNR